MQGDLNSWVLKEKGAWWNNCPVSGFCSWRDDRAILKGGPRGGRVLEAGGEFLAGVAAWET